MTVILLSHNRFNRSTRLPDRAGSTHDLVGACGLIGMVHHLRRLLAGHAYDAKSLRDELALRRIKAVIPPNPTRKHPHHYDIERCPAVSRTSVTSPAFRGGMEKMPWPETLSLQSPKIFLEVPAILENDQPAVFQLFGNLPFVSMPQDFA